MAVERVNWLKLKERRLRNTAGLSERNVTFDIIEEPLAVHINKKTKQKTVSGGIRVRLSPPVAVSGAPDYDSFPLFTFTTKMSCASFGLPSGRGCFGGTCPASNPALFADGRIASSSPDPDGGRYAFICDICYAGKGRYKFATYIHLCQQARALWITKLMKAGGVAAFAGEMSKAIVLLNRLSNLSVAKVCDPQYFRIHDSGDFRDPAYQLGWIEVARRMSHIRFWVPTRTWVFPQWSQSVKDVPLNLAIRPSALFINMIPPMLPGYSAGSMCAKAKQLDARPPRAVLPGGVYDCPAYKGGTIYHTCIAKKCRVCWDDQNVPVNYREH
jgi:hypothetical protein